MCSCYRDKEMKGAEGALDVITEVSILMLGGEPETRVFATLSAGGSVQKRPTSLCSPGRVWLKTMMSQRFDQYSEAFSFPEEAIVPSWSSLIKTHS